MRKHLVLAAFTLLVLSFSGNAQQTASQIYHQFKKLNNLSSALYIAAHPDDENTRLIAHLSKTEMARTAYLSLTRGDGGQNLIGNEKGELLGIIRTQELLEARKIDGGTQFFTRAVDFGYSKTSDETLNFWDAEKVLSDMVYVIRKFKPDVLITRFPPDNYAGHGHHSSSAILAEKAFTMAGNPNAFPEQLSSVTIWQPKSLYLNTSTWWFKEVEKEAVNNPDYIILDIGQYNPFLGRWINELGSEARSQHKSQGFGVSLSRGTQLEYFKHVAGEKRENNFFLPEEMSWNRMENGAKISKLITQLISDFDFAKPENSVPQLIKIYNNIKSINHELAQFKLSEVEDLIIACLGLHPEAIAKTAYATPNQNIQITAKALLGTQIPVQWQQVSINNTQIEVNQQLTFNNFIEQQFSVSLQNNEISQPYWLKKPYKNLFQVENQSQIGMPQNQPALTAKFTFKIANELITISRPVVYKWTDRVEGERQIDFKIYPEITMNPAEKVMLFYDQNPKSIDVLVRNFAGGGLVQLNPKVPANWQISPLMHEINFDETDQAKTVSFIVTPPQEQSFGNISFVAKAMGKVQKQSIVEIGYNHITKQVVFPDATTEIIKINLKNTVKKVGYIAGAGDEIPACLKTMGIEVVSLLPQALVGMDLTEFDALVAGVRLFNTNPEMAFSKANILKYVEAGGTFVVQYNTHGGLNENTIGPFPLKISRGRVTDETAIPKFLNPNHPILNIPNKISQSDFDFWVQERGLYFAEWWDDAYQPIISWNDNDEEPLNGGLLVADFGKGAFIYTGISFFRQLPAGVPGAYRLFVNLLNYKPVAVKQ